MDQVSIDALLKEIKALRKDMRKIRQHMEDPQGEKAKARAANNGFNKPMNVSPELRSFLSLAEGEQISRSQVTRRINTYVEELGLKNGQKINLNAVLQELLKVPENTQVTFLNIQKYINPHYIKEPAAPKAPKAATPVEEPVAPKEKKLRPKVVKAAAAA
jgi:upstream activation factor subunit UAF30